MSSPFSTSIADAPHYRWSASCDGGHLLAGEDPSVIEEHMPPGMAEQRHRHDRARQFFCVLEGDAVLELNGARHVLRTGQLRAGQELHVLPGMAHPMRSEGTAEVRFLVTSAPKSLGDRIAAPLEAQA